MQPISKTNIVITGIVIAAMAGVLITYHKPKALPPPVQNITPVVAPTTTSWPSIEVKKETISDSNQYYTIDATYPVTSDGAVNDRIKSFVDAQIAQFKQDTAWVTDPTTQSSSEGSLSLDINYREQKSAKADTYIFDIGTYTGGAHGLEVSRTFAFDSTGKLITTVDLFTNGTDGLKTIAAFVQKEITKKGISDANWIADGAGAKPENYQNFIISDDGVTFIFDPYQVAAYADGAQNILVPVSVFKSIANPAYFLK